MAERDRIAAAAEKLADLRLRRNGARPPLNDLHETIRPRTIAEAYDAQTALHERLSPDLGAIVGWKIGCSAAVMQAYLGVDHPCMGGLFASGVRHGGATLDAADYRRLGLECEIAVRLSADLHPGEDPAAAFASVMTSVEIVEERFVSFDLCAKETLIADDFFSAGCVLGAEVPVGQAGDLRAIVGGFTVNGDEGERGAGAAILGDPLAALAWLAEARARFGGLKAGEIVTLGSVVRTIYPAAGDRVVGALTRLGEVEIEIL